jgi:radical SAM protein with 4Fe4S-binding SPASM domain
MSYFLSPDACLKWLETPSVYHARTDELYELDEASFDFLRRCSSEEGCSDSDGEFIDYCLHEGILSSDPINIIRPALSKAPQPSLRYLELQITDRCNLRCKHCYIGKDQVHELSVGQVRDILREFEQMQGLRVLITGGEPLLHSNFLSLNNLLPEFSLRKVLFSNGLLISRQLLKTLNVQEIQISIDGLEKAHDILRGTNSFVKAMRAVHLCLEAGFEVSVSTMVHTANLNDFEEMDRLFRETGVRDWTVDVPCVSGRLTTNTGLSVSPEIGGRYLKYGFGQGLHGSSQGYGCGLHLMSVMADGRASKCTFYSDNNAGSVEDGLENCWKRIAPVRLRDLECDCEYLEACRGGCRFRAETLGNPLGRDLYRCFLYDIIKTTE